MTDIAVSISDDDAHRIWAANLMAGSEPWIRLGRGHEQCLAAVQPRDDTQLFVARDGTVPCGFALLRSRGLAGSPYLVSIAVEEPYRGGGVGTLLLDHVEAHFRPSAKHMFLCVSSFNGGARRLYERRGYSTVGALPDYVVDGASEILMLKRLDRP